MLAALAVAAIAGLARANTEVAVFSVAADAAGGVLAPLEPLTAEFLFRDVSESVALPLSAPAGRYLARVCWPANHPADLSIAYDAESSAVVVAGSVENIVSLRGNSRSVPFDVHLSPMHFGLVPVDVVPAILSTALVAVLSIWIAYILLKRI